MTNQILDIDLTFAGTIPDHVELEQSSQKIRGKVANQKQSKSVEAQVNVSVPHYSPTTEDKIHVSKDEPVMKSEMEAEL